MPGSAHRAARRRETRARFDWNSTIMNAINHPKSNVLSLETLAPVAPSNERRLARPVRDDDPFTRCYRRFTTKLRAAAAMYVDRADIDDLVQDVWTVAAQSPAKLAASDARTLSWLIGIAKRCSPTYASANTRFLPLDELLAGESGDDLEGRGMYEDVEELRAELWGKGG
jgi:DNA-directed RNA polymerase specialized sigma24 family protein